MVGSRGGHVARTGVPRSDAARKSAAYRLSAKTVFQLVLIFVLFAAVLISLSAWSSYLRRGLIVPTEVRRALLALERATSAAVRRRALRVPLAAAVCVGVLILAQQLLPGSATSVAAVLGAIGAYSFGVVAVVVLSVLCGQHARKHTFAGIAGASISMERSLSIATSSAALLTMAAEVSGVVLAALVHGTILLISATDPGLSSSLDHSRFAMRASTYFGIGAVVASLAMQQVGSICVGASKLAGGSAFDARTALPATDPRNPTVLSDAMAHHLGNILPRTLDMFVGGVLAATLCFALGSIPASTGLGGLEAIAFVPLLTRAFGLFATLVALLTLRASEHEDPIRSFARSELVAYVVLGSALAGIVVWLLGSSHVSTALAIGLGLTLAPALGRLRAYLLRRPRAPRGSAEDGLGQSPLTTLDCLVPPLGAMLVTLLFYASTLGLLCVWLGHGIRSEGPYHVALLFGLAVSSSLSALNHIPTACRDFAAIGSFAATIGRVPLSDEAQHRLRKSAEAFDRICVGSSPVVTDTGVLTCGLAAVVCQLTHLRAPTSSTPVLLLAGIGLFLVIPSGLALFECLRASAKATRTQTNEVDRQLRGMRRELARVIVPEDFVPSYRSCVELLARDSAQGGLVFAVAVVVFPALAAYLGRIPENSAGSTSLTLASYGAIAAAVGLFATQLGHAASAANFLAPRSSVLARGVSVSPSVPVSESLRMIEFLGHSMSVSVPLLTKAVALVTLMFSASLV